jgi:hypothetical protein
MQLVPLRRGAGVASVARRGGRSHGGRRHTIQVAQLTAVCTQPFAQPCTQPFIVSVNTKIIKLTSSLLRCVYVSRRSVGGVRLGAGDAQAAGHLPYGEGAEDTSAFQRRFLALLTAEAAAA